jgi:hypothetical protein
MDIPLQSLGTIVVTAFEPGTNRFPADATITIAGADLIQTGQTTTGPFIASDLPLGNYRITALKRLTDTRSIATTNVNLAFVGGTNFVELILSGVGSVSGQVFASDGVTPLPSASVRLSFLNNSFSFDSEDVFAGVDGSFSFDNLPLGPYRLTVVSGALAASFTGEITTNGEADTVTLRLGDSGSIIGRLVRPNGAPVGDVTILLSLTNQASAFAQTRTSPTGDFAFSNVPLGTFRLEAFAPQFAGFARRLVSLSANGQVLNLGDVPLDEDDPHVLHVSPANTASGIPITTTVDLFFNEPLAFNSINNQGVFLRLGTNDVPVTLNLLPDPTNGVMRLVRLTPNLPLLSERTYEVVVIDGQRLNALGNVIGKGPTDLVERPLTVPFVSTFTTADNDPPLLVSIFPTNSQVEIDPRAVMRLNFNEPIRDTNFSASLTGPQGTVAGVASVGLNSLVLNFAPAAPLKPNSTFILTVSNVFDLAGNRFASEPILVSFSTLDTLPPEVQSLELAQGQLPIASSIVTIQATLRASELDATVSFVQDGNPAGIDSTPPYQATISLPTSGSTIITAKATDRFGNPGTNATLVLNVVSNQPPVLTFVRNTPAAGPLTNNQPFSITVSAVDDVGVSNITVAASGSISLLNIFPSGGQRILNLAVPANSPPGQAITLRALATDLLGLSSTEQIIALEILDRQAPLVQILSPAENALLDPAQPLRISVVSSDNGGNHSLLLNSTGALTVTTSLPVVSAPNARQTNEFVIPLPGLALDGSEIEVRIQATDLTNSSPVVTRRTR